MSKKQKIIFWPIFIFCFLIQILPVIRSGLEYNYGIGFWGSNGHDAIWHLSLINHIKNPLEIEMPSLSGQTLKNYHPFYDIIIAFFSAITHIPAIFLYFQIFPIVSTIILLTTSFLLGRQLTSKFSGGIILIFLNTFANSFGWLITLFRNHTISGESLFWSMQSASNQLNPPFVLSLILINLLLLLILNQKINLVLKNILILLILILTPITKAYGGVVVYSIFTFYSLLMFKKDKKPLLLFLISLPIAFLIFNIYNSSSTSLFVFQPFWFINSLIESPDRLYIPFLANMRYSLESSGIIGPRLICLYTFSIGLFYLGNFSWRLLGIFSLKSFKNILKTPIFITILITALIPLFFIQKGTSWNTIQFLYYSLFLSNIFLALFLTKIQSKKIFFAIVIITTLIPSWENIYRYLSNPAPATISNLELEALNFLKNQPNGFILTYPYDKYKKQNLKAPVPIYLYETTAYVSAFSNKQTFLEDEMNLDITGFDWKTRLSDEQKFFNTKDIFFARGFLLNNKIDYIYLVGDQNLPISTFDLQINKIFENSQVRIYKTQK